MNAETLHDALGHLPTDLLLPVEELRNAPRKRKVPWLRYGALAACLALAVWGGSELLPLVQKTAQNESIFYEADNADGIQAPAEGAPLEENKTESSVEQPKSVFGGSTDLMAGKPIRELHLAEIPEGSIPATDFALDLFRASLDGEENTLISPLSVLLALGMIANGAEGNTLAQMEATLGMGLSDLNDYLYCLMDGQDESLKLANAIWFRDQGLEVRDTFLNTVSTYYRAGIYQAPMDESTVKTINRWVEENTDGMIQEILSQLNPETVMCLVNALAFEAQWEEAYQKHQVNEGTFHTAGGLSQTVEFMNSKEYAYLEDDNATGFVKYYEGRNYAFAALLPNEDISLEDYVNSLTGEHLQSLIAHPQQITTYAAMPKFEAEYMGDLSKTLAAMGMPDAFDWQLADFSPMGTADNGNIYISQVLHRTYISAAEQGTKAGAATAVVMYEGTALVPKDCKYVTLDRPFLYLIWDCQENLPLFVGTLLAPA